MGKLSCVGPLVLGVVGCRGGTTDHLFAAATSGASVTAVLVKDINPGPASSSPREMASVVGLAFFAADDGVHGEELWKSEGTEEGTVLVKDINPGPPSSARAVSKLPALCASFSLSSHPRASAGRWLSW